MDHSVSLPDDPFPIRALHAAYRQCLTLEAKAEAGVVEFIKHCPPPIVCARLLGHMLRLAPAGKDQGKLQRGITSANDHATLMQLASVYMNNFIRAFKRSSGSTPAPSTHPSRPSFEDAREYAMGMMEESKLDHRSARALAMRRDDDRCMITGLKDIKHGGGVQVQTAHIIPESTNKDTAHDGEKSFQSTGVWSILSMFTDDSIIEDLTGNRIHRLENIISMNVASHGLFDDLCLWLKPVERAPHKYRVYVAKEEMRHFGPLPEYMTFSTATTLPLPNHEYLALHALCCEVAWMSGAAEYIMDIERRMDDTKVLANDGSNVDLLVTALSLVETC